MVKHKEKVWKYSDNPEPQILHIEQDITEYFDGVNTLKELCKILGDDTKPTFEYVYDNYEQDAWIVYRYERLETQEEIDERLFNAKVEREEYAKKIQNEVDKRTREVERKKLQVVKLLKEIEEMDKQ